jgi:hypothetical protein
VKVSTKLQRHGLTDDEILRLFKNAQGQLIAIIERADPSRPFSEYRTQHLREIELVILKLERKLGGATSRQVKTLYTAGSTETADIIRGFDEKEFRFSFAGVNKEAVDVLTSGALAEFGNTIRALRANGSKALFDKKKLNDRIIEGVIQGSSVYRTQNQLIDALKSDGITVLKAKNGFGRRFNLQHYTNTLVRSQSMSAYNLGAKKVMLSTGRRYAKILKIVPDIDGDDICNEFERQIYVDLKQPEQLPPYHPNCRHVPVPVSFAELKANRPDLYPIAVRFFQS